MSKSMMVGAVLAISVLALSPLGGASLGADKRVGIVVDTRLDRPAGHGLAALEGALRQRGFSVQRFGEVVSAQADFLILAGLASPA
jgi:hypothetical protein